MLRINRCGLRLESVSVRRKVHAENVAMDKVERIIEQARRLPRQDRRRVITALTKSGPNGKRALKPRKRSAAGTTRRLSALDAFLALAGTAHSDYTNVSSDKYKHLAEIYADTHERS